MQNKQRDVRLLWNVVFRILQQILQIANFLRNKERDVRFLLETLQSHPFLMLRKFETQGC